MENITIVQKEHLQGLHFLKSEVLTENILRQRRQYNLNRALILSNLDHNKALITFKTEENYIFKVEATIWAVTEDYILLKGGVTIPVRSIVDLDY